MDKITAFFAALYHDAGKLASTKWNEKKHDVQSINHETVSAKIADESLKVFVPSEYHKQIVTIVKHHMLHESISDKKLCRLADEIAQESKQKICLNDIITFRNCDGLGRICSKTPEQIKETNEKLRERALQNNVLFAPLPQLITGKDLVEIGFKPGKIIGQIIEEIRLKQHAKEISTIEQAIDFAARRFKNYSFEENS